MRDGLNGSPEVGIDHLTMLDVSPPDLVGVAREAGFDLVGLRIVPATPAEEPWPMSAGGLMVEETARRLDDTGVGVLSVEVVRIGPGTRREDYEQALEVGSRLQARYVTVNVDDPDIERACEAFATMTDDARPYGLRPLVEPIPYTEVSNLGEAVHIARRSDGGGILLDTLHFQRYGGHIDQLRSLDRDLLAYVQLCDGPLATPSEVPHPPSLPRGQSTDGTDLQLESRAMRLLPGEGELPLRAFLAALPAGIPVSVEAPVLSLQKSLSPVEFARRARAAVANVVPETGGNPDR
jgi:sugar phosphate isomerase/epimerase